MGFGCGVAVSELTDWAWGIRYPLIIVAVLVTAGVIRVVRG